MGVQSTLNNKKAPRLWQDALLRILRDALILKLLVS